ncbi:MAG: hypothetical protein EXR18_03765 [Flavobacteriaceae bacterium]|nr:hypothetical protein [Flavobacteriaceae bacterium]
MKKNILTTAALFLFALSNAQNDKVAVQGFSKGNLLVSGEVSFVSRSWGGNSTALISPAFVYFTTDNISVSARYTNEKSGPLSSKGFGIGSAYHFNAGKQFSSQLGLNLDLGTMKNGTEDYTTKNFDIVFGINYFVSNHLFLGANLAGLTHRIVSPKVGPEVETTSLGFNTNNISFNVGYKF